MIMKQHCTKLSFKIRPFNAAGDSSYFILSMISLVCMLLIPRTVLTEQTTAPPYKTGYAYDARCTTYYQNSSEVPQRVKWINQRLEQQSLIEKLVPITPVADPLSWIAKVHTQEHIKGIQSVGVDTLNGATEAIGVIAELAAGYVLGAVRDVCEGKVNNAFAAIRPPGHHVTNEGYMVGFCAYANVVIAARYAREMYNITRILFIDWDFHYGNGTEYFECTNANSFLFEFGYADDSSSQCNLVGNHIITRGVGNGTNEDFEKVFTEYLVGAMDNFKPELIIISCGFDLKKNDGLGSYSVTAQGISRLTKIMMDIANKHSQGRVVSILEGGYYDRGSSPATFFGLSQCAENHVRTLLTGEIQSETPYFIDQGINNTFKKKLPYQNYLRNGILSIPNEKNPVRAAYLYDLQGRLLWQSEPISAPAAVPVLQRGSPGLVVLKLQRSNGETVSMPVLLKR